MSRATKRVCLSILLSSLVAACDDSSSSSPPGDTPEYVSQSPASSSNGNLSGGVPTSDSSGGKGAALPPAASNPEGTTGAGVPGGRVADVQEADIYKVAGGKLYLLNTYRGFLIYDISNTKAPVRLGRLPVYGYPVEMFVENNTVYALLSDSLYLSTIDGKLQFQKRNSSQIVTIDISDPANPKLLQAQDLPGQLREGVARKIENTIYVVSYQPTGYWFWGWGARNGAQPNEQAWVYSFDASTPSNLKQVGKVKIFEGGSTNTYNQATGETHTRYSNGVSLSATSNAIMVVQNWYAYDWVPPTSTGGAGGSTSTGWSCGSTKTDQDSVVSVVDVSDPTGAIRVAATFSTAGALSDQFKQTYVYDAQAKTGTYLGIFARRSWTGSGCNYSSQTQNTLESWNLNGDGTASKLSAVDFGKPNETVRGSYFDVDRKVAFAITAQSMDPMYAISFADRASLKILSAIDGLSGDMDLFRPVEGGQYLLAVGRDTGAACAGYVPPGTGGSGDPGKTSTWSNQISVSLIDVRDLAKIRLVQRKCLDVANAGWIGSQVTWNLDQAHKMIGLESDGTTNVLTVPIAYSVTDNSAGDGWYYYRYETAVGIMSWDISQYRDTLPPEQQNVIATHGHFVHPNGEVNRSVVYKAGETGPREMLNISDSYLSLANIQNLDAPVLDSVVEVAAADQAVFAFGNYVVEQVALPSSDYRQTSFEFRVKAAGPEIESAPVLARFTVGQLQQVIRHGNLLAMFRMLSSLDANKNTVYTSQVVVYDLSNPLAPKAVGSSSLPNDYNPYGSYYRYYCGGIGYFGGYYFGYTQGMAVVDEGIAFLITNVDYQPKAGTSEYVPIYTYKLVFLDLRNPSQPVATEQSITLPGVRGNQAESASLVADSMATDGFYVAYRVQVGQTVDSTTNSTLYSYANYAQRWLRKSGAWATEPAINIPGSLVRSWGSTAGQRLFLTRDDVYSSKQIDGGGWQWIDTVTLSLLTPVGSGATTRAAKLADRTFGDMTPKSLVYDGDRIYAVVSDTPYYWGYPVNYGDSPSGGTSTGGTTTDTGTADASDRLVIIDASLGSLASAYEQPTGLTNLDLMGARQNRLFVNLEGDGILVADVTSATAPKPMSFYRTLGWASGIEFAGTSAYVPANYYGTYRLDLTAAGNL